MELQQLKYFKAVAENGKICEAADTLFISPPALSTSISRLEKELGFPLFDRTNNKIILNQQGQIFLKYVKQIFASLESGIDEMQQSFHIKDSHISMLCVDTGTWVNLISAFTSEYPNLNLLCSTATLKKLTDNGLSPQHCLLLADDLNLPSGINELLCSTPLFDMRTSVMVHKDHPLSSKDFVTIEDLKNERIFMPVQGSGFHNRLLQLFEHNDLSLPVENAYALLARQQMITQNLGISFSVFFPDKSYHPSIRYIPFEDPFGPWKARMYWKKNHAFTQDELLFKKYVEFYYRLH